MKKSSPRTATLSRTTKETSITLTLNLDGQGTGDILTPIGFLNHMLELFACHSRFDLTLNAEGDTHTDDHHLVEDVGIVLGQALAQSLGDKAGITRYGAITLPMDEVLITTALDLSGRYAFVTNYAPRREMVGELSTEMVPHFFHSFAQEAKMALHLHFLEPGINEHHRIEAMFKSTARALRQAVAVDALAGGAVPSSKGTLT